MPLDQIGDVYVAGRWRSAHSGDRTVVTIPTTEEPLAQVVDADRSDIDSAVRAADAAARDHDDKKLTGSFHGGISMRRDSDMLIGFWRTGRLPIEKLISGTADLKEINEVVAAQRAGTVVRTVLTMD